MKKYLIISIIILSLIGLKILTTFVLNEIVISNYEKKVYKESIISYLKLTNTNETYIVYYNEGNILYQKEKYDEAINHYEKALTKNPPLVKKCDIRVNKTLAMIKRIDTTKREDLIQELEKAKQELYEDHCADKNNESGKSKDAEELENEIEEMIEEAKNKPFANQNNQDPQNEEGEEEETEEEQNIESQLNNINKDANASRQKDLQTYENLSDYHYYSGKNW